MHQSKAPSRNTTKIIASRLLLLFRLIRSYEGKGAKKNVKDLKNIFYLENKLVTIENALPKSKSSVNQEPTKE